MKGALVRCVRCKGRKKLFKVAGAYSYVDTGGEKVDCPMCLGSGSTKSLADALEDIKELNSKKKSVDTQEKDFDNGDKKESGGKRTQSSQKARKAN